MTNILLGIIALELMAIFSKLDKLEERKWGVKRWSGWTN